ncbi:exo-1,3-beta-glucanase [Exidia glandulosa HHB12029]|uniref:Exo-1,3-beta-glucanase n=1 Tax=Exidia glandulosa HHB12029 TaxID=1314781 RepID=A0A165EJY1_EXIGL|nr:exo-1,3-beta-glucanase [Exidia glandulosa HHB12029]
MHGVTFLSASLLAVVLLAHCASAALSYGFPYGKTKVRGVNLGGWLVLEPWITPSLFDKTNDSRVIDEYTYGQYVPKATAQANLKAHWDSWITEQDFITIAGAGLNHVRLPVGFWAYDTSGGEPYITGQAAYVTKAVTWAKNHGIKIILDIHGAPGSQNGFDNSGRRGDPLWHKSQTNVDRTNSLMKKLTLQYANQVSVVSSIAPLNEPATYKDSAMLPVVRQYWKDSYGNTRYPYGNSTKGNTLELIHDAFQPLSYWNDFMPYPKYEGVAIDTHIYQMFHNEGVNQTDAQHIQSACNNAAELSSFTALWVIIGEWTTSPNDCAKYLNGRGKGARYDGTFPGSPRVGSCTNLTTSASNFSSSYKTLLRQMWEAQVTTFENNAQGWVYWTWKTEQAPEWSYMQGLSNGWIPTNPAERKYPNICG